MSYDRVHRLDVVRDLLSDFHIAISPTNSRGKGSRDTRGMTVSAVVSGIDIARLHNFLRISSSTAIWACP